MVSGAPKPPNLIIGFIVTYYYVMLFYRHRRHVFMVVHKKSS